MDNSYSELLGGVEQMAVVCVTNLVDVVVGAGAGGTTGQRNITLRFTEGVLRHGIQFGEAILLVVASVGVARH